MCLGTCTCTGLGARPGGDGQRAPLAAGCVHLRESLEAQEHYGRVKTARAKPQVARILAGTGAGLLAIAVVAAIVAVGVELSLDSALARDEADGAPDQIRP